MAPRQDLQIASHGEILDAWMYRANGVAHNVQSPVIILAQGLGGTKDMRLFEYCERFSAAGFVCVVFDYRFWGKSTGHPRGLVDVEAQLADWNVVIDYAAKLPQVDSERIGIFGSSFCGGHVIRLAATNPKVKATVSQCPFTDGFASTCAIGFAPLPKLAWLALCDVFWSTQQNPVRVPLLGDPGEAALMSTEECKPGYQKLLPPGMTKLEIDAVPARLILHMPFLYPGAYAKSVPTPIYFAICGRDTVTPPEATLKFVKLAPKGIIEMYTDSNHFDIYVGQLFERAIADYIAFFKKNLMAC